MKIQPNLANYGRLALLKKDWADYEQLLRAVFHGQNETKYCNIHTMYVTS